MPNDDDQPVTIPTSGITIEQQINNDDLAENELNSITGANYTSKVNDSTLKNTLEHHSLYRWGIRIIFILMCSFVIFVLSVFVCLIYHYMHTLLSCPEKLEHFLNQVWTIMTGASVIVFVQLISWTVKKKADESEER